MLLTKKPSKAKQSTQQAFIQRCVNGERAAWDEFVDRYSRLIYNYILSVFKNRGIKLSHETREDLYQEIFLHLVKDNFKKLRQFKGKHGASLASWLRVLVINFCLDYLKKKRIKTTYLEEKFTEEGGLRLADVLSDRLPLADRVVIEQEKLEALSACISILNLKERHLLEMHIYQGIDLEFLRQDLGISRSTIDMRKQRLMKRLRKCFEEKGLEL
ncbi:MAG: sigma-70 family RNA polymerase sigma factor [Candidatus Omnitrophica bacterium]|nr:sigma-70 family RNA polymerase sigma factor [Candidatus Omnitrophota bacterium]